MCCASYPKRAEEWYLKESKLNYREALVRRLRDLKTVVILDAGTSAGVMTRTLVNSLSLVCWLDILTMLGK